MPTRDEIKKFSMMIEKLVGENSLGYMDAICHHCKETGLEIEVAATLVNDTLKELIESEAAELHYLPKSGKLPL